MTGFLVVLIFFSLIFGSHHDNPNGYSEPYRPEPAAYTPGPPVRIGRSIGLGIIAFVVLITLIPSLTRL
jgi:hypothetical protein